MPTITQLEYIIAVDTYRHFGIAAKKCFVTQPTLSMQIKKAEEELGIIIFDRSKQPVIPTDLGEILIVQARIILREMQRLDELIIDFKNEVTGTLRLGIIPTLAPYLLPLFVGNLIRKYPKINLVVKELPTEEIISALHSDLLDIGLLVTPMHEPSIREIPLFYEEIKLYLNATHQLLEEYPKSVPVNALQDNEPWLLSHGHCFRNQIINICSISDSAKTETVLPFEYEGSSLEALQRLVDREGGFTLFPELAISKNIEGHIKSLEKPVPLREVSLVYVQNFAKIRFLEILKTEILSSIPSHLQEMNRGQVVEWR
jgi:LysR family hydrogen peroxide-inducible transcriptional activator